MRDRLITFALQLKKRRTQGQKNRFIEILFDYMDTLGYSIKIQQFKHQNKNGRNIIVGDLAEAEVVFLADYDTKERIWNDDYRYYPFDETFNMKVLQSNVLKNFIFGTIFLVATVLLIVKSTSVTEPIRFVYYGLAACSALVSIILGRGVSSPYNFKKTASIFLLFEYAKLKNPKYCYVFLDHSLFTGAGKYYFINEYQLKGKKLIYIDNAAVGTTVMVASSKKLKAEAAIYLDIDSAKEKKFEYYYLSLGLIDDSNTFCIDKIGTKSDVEFSEEDYLKLKDRVDTLLENWE